MAISAARVTRLGKSGYMTRPYGSFAGKTATEVVSVLKKSKRLFRMVAGHQGNN